MMNTALLILKNKIKKIIYWYICYILLFYSIKIYIYQNFDYVNLFIININSIKTVYNSYFLIKLLWLFRISLISFFIYDFYVYDFNYLHYNLILRINKKNYALYKIILIILTVLLSTIIEYLLICHVNYINLKKIIISNIKFTIILILIINVLLLNKEERKKSLIVLSICLLLFFNNLNLLTILIFIIYYINLKFIPRERK